MRFPGTDSAPLGHSTESVPGSTREGAAAALVVLRLDGREYALPVADVEEVLPMVAMVPVPGAPPWLAGVINLRGRTVPVVDLRTRLGLPPTEPGLRTPILVASAGGRPVGLIADEVVEALGLTGESIEPPDELAGAAHPFSALARAADRVIPVFDVERLTAGAGDLSLPDVHAR